MRDALEMVGMRGRGRREARRSARREMRARVAELTAARKVHSKAGGRRCEATVLFETKQRLFWTSLAPEYVPFQ